MRPEELAGNAPGRCVRTIGPAGGYWAFVPDPLPPHLEYRPSTIALLSDADQALGELKGVGRMLPNPRLLIGPFVRQEAVLSSRIEGTITNLEQLLLFEADPREDEEFADREEVANYVRALRYGLERLGALPLSLRFVREVHERLMNGVRGAEKSPGKFRDRQNMIGRDGQTPAEARFVPPPMGELMGCLAEFERFLSRRSDLPVLVEIALIHYQFETIHPFLDGNGRLGRLLISILLCERGCLTQPMLYLSAYLEEHKDAYMDHLLSVSREGDWVGWIEFFLRGVATQSRAASACCNNLLDLRDRYKGRAHEVSKSSTLLQLVDLLFERPAITITQVKELLGVTFHSARDNVEKLVAEGILAEVTGKSKNRIYMCKEILEVVER